MNSEWVKRQSFVEGSTDSPFPIQNLPYGAFLSGEEIHLGVAIGPKILDLTLCARKGLLGAKSSYFQTKSLNRFMSSGPLVWGEMREQIQELLDEPTPTLRDDAALRSELLIDRDTAEMVLPVEIGDYTDFYSSRYHAENVGKLFRGEENALLPNYLELPVAYHGRASSVVLSGQSIHRPRGQLKLADSERPNFEPSRQLDFELEIGFFIGQGNRQGMPISVDEAADQIFGFVLVNDWSARDIQAWEYQPLGPFNSKNFATTISPWVVPLEALKPFRVNGPAQSPEPLEYLRGRSHWSLDIPLEVQLQTSSMAAPETISRSNVRHLYWTPSQQIAHHTSTGCNLRPGDLLASGTISGPTSDSYGSMLELTKRGKKPLVLTSGESRAFLEDGDTITMRAECEREGIRIGFGEATATLLPASGKDEQ